jgi:hypothetical protein
MNKDRLINQKVSDHVKSCKCLEKNLGYSIFSNRFEDAVSFLTIILLFRK